MAETQASRQTCPGCLAEALLNSRSRGVVEDFYSVLGADLYRCQECAARFAFFRRFALRLGRTNQAGEIVKTKGWLVPAAIFGGIVVCLLIALVILRRFQRWPF